MFYVYVLLSLKDDKLYIGCTNDLKDRLGRHNKGQVKSTTKRKPFILIYYEAFLDEHDAFMRERGLKTGRGRNQLKKILKSYFAKRVGK